MKLQLRAGVAAFIMFGSTALAQTAPAVRDIAGMRMIVYTPAGVPNGSVLLIPGGSTRVEILASGELRSGQGNFLIRSRERFIAKGYVTAMLDDPRNVAAAVEALHALAPPVFVIGTSNGTIVAATAASRMRASGAAGMVLTSTVTRPGNTFPSGVNAGMFANAQIPLLFIHNRNDGCRASPLSPVEGMVSQLSGDVTLQTVSSTQASSDPCEPFSPHGYMGIEDATVSAIAAWMDAHH
jgi:hypothetical protein